MNNGKSVVAVLKTYFGMKPDQNLQGFAGELAQLGEDGKLELARLAAKEQGLGPEDVAFEM